LPPAPSRQLIDYIKKRGNCNLSASEVPPSTHAPEKYSPRRSVSVVHLLKVRSKFGGFQTQE